MHQPCYKDLVSGEYRLPWTRMHGLKDYFGMVEVLRQFPRIRQTFNLVPSLVQQVEDYAGGAAQDPFLRAALKPAEDLTEDEMAFILQYFFQANPGRLIYRYPRYGELYEAWHAADRNVRRACRMYGAAGFRDLQVLSQLAWFDEEFIDHDEETGGLARKGRDYTPEDQALMGRKQREILGRVLPVYREFAESGQIEISTTPFYHPILPLICDTDIAGVSHPFVPLPTRFRYPEDARVQLERSRQYILDKLGVAPKGLWPSEGSVSDEALEIAAQAGFKWAATDNGVLARTLGHPAGCEATYKPYQWKRGKHKIHVLFRDHHLSDLVGFVYSRMGAAEAAAHFLDRIRQNCSGILASGQNALVPIILDGENAWEYYDRNGRPFLRELYRRIEDDSGIRALTVSEALKQFHPSPLDHIMPGSWINANFDVWLGAEEDNKAWEYLLKARETYARAADGNGGLSDRNRQLALEELLIAEGSDWNWWYGPEHDSANRPEFDQLFRDHLANVYRALGQSPPEELSRPILRTAVTEFHEPPSGPIRAAIDGDVTSYFEWLGSGVYRVDGRSGAMHGHRYLLKELRYGSDSQDLYLRLDFEQNVLGEEMEVRFVIQGGGKENRVRLKINGSGLQAEELSLAGSTVSEPASFAFQTVLEVRLSLAALGVPAGHPARIQLSVWQDGLPMDALPQQGFVEASTAEIGEWG